LLHTFHLLAANSLVQPPTKSNIEYDDSIKQFLSLKFGKGHSINNKKKENQRSQKLIDALNSTEKENTNTVDHDIGVDNELYSSLNRVTESKMSMVYYLLGFIIRKKLQLFKYCSDCYDDVIDVDGVSNRYAELELTNLKNQGGLIYPTVAFELLWLVEEHIIKFIENGKVALKYTYDSILNSICSDSRIRFKHIGCFVYCDELTANNIIKYITNRMYHYEAQENLGSSVKAQNLRKQAKLS